NHQEIYEEYLTDVELKSETDTEVIVQLMEKLAEKTRNTAEACRDTVRLLNGSYAIALIDNQDRENVYVAKNKSPLLIGLGDEFNVVTSDTMATLKWTDKYLEIHDGEIVMVGRHFTEVQKLNGTVVDRTPFRTQIDAVDTEKGTYPHFK